MIRSFLPVGQGAFYVEKFESGDVYVYDCGTASGIEIIKREICKNFSKGETIEGVFISHLHDDHVNGLEYLLQHCNVRNVYLPYLTPEEIALTYAGGICGKYESSEFLRNFLEDPTGTIGKANSQSDTNVRRIIPLEDNVQEHDIGYSTLRSGNEIDTSTKMVDNIEWVFVPFNFRNTTRMQQFYKELAKHGVDRSDFKNIEAFKEKWVRGEYDYRERLAEAYKSVAGNLNTNSLVVYSGVKRALPKLYWRVKKIEVYVNNYCCESIVHAPGCLYLGDYDLSGKLKWKELMCNSMIANYIDYMGMIQVPHHGSRLNHDHRIADFNSVFIISAGSSNRYRHPSVKVVMDILKKDRKLIIVNEDEDALVRFEVGLCQL